ncbi:tRNA1(Val) (adenine(37)-N6)-methyltransferase [Bartonella tamiae]|uniref:Methyltransferase small domain-containing protein n=1 Tax=Bartonella tamiae Th239 TaxID=1094558 RepID=J0QWV2_9HYPH|nr:methyltransferase [Bartonella tamiae]EJF90501.1 hypothetical protein ME5_00902 [Bartonella tamiae Th239]EJF93555.1 hypothetical protein MEG_00979 [Bartonella tamiae Th307]
MVDIHHDNETLDEFHRGGFYLVQSRRQGHRSGMDAMILAGLVPTSFKGRVVDLGAGAGAAGFAVAARCINTDVTLVERSPVMFALAKKSLSLSQNKILKTRISILQADVTLKGRYRVEAGLKNNMYDFAVMNPPFNFSSDRRTPDVLKAEAHVMEDTMFEDWLRCAAAIVKPGGFLGLIARPQSLEHILLSMKGRFGDIKIIALHPRDGQPAIRILVHARRASKAPLQILPSLIIHMKDEQCFTTKIDNVNNGLLSLWDLP